MNSITSSDLRRDLQPTLDQIITTGEPVVVTEHGRPSVGLVPTWFAYFAEQIDSITADIARLPNLAEKLRVQGLVAQILSAIAIQLETSTDTVVTINEALRKIGEAVSVIVGGEIKKIELGIK